MGRPVHRRIAAGATRSPAGPSVAWICQRAAEALRAGRVTEAVEGFSQARTLRPGDAAIHVNLGYALRESERYADALESYDRAVKLQPGLAEAHFQRGISLRRLQRDGNALQAFQQVLKLDPKHVGAQEHTAQIHAQAGRFADAEACFRRVLMQQPERIDLTLELATVVRAQHRPDESLVLLLQAQRALPDNLDLSSLIAGLLLELERFDEALPIFDALIHVQPEKSEHYVGRGSVLNGSGRHLDALRDLDYAISIDHKSAAAWNNRGSALQGLRRFDEAIASFERAISIDATHADPHNNLGNALRDVQRWADALGAISRAIHLRPDYADAFYNRAVVWADLKQRDACVADYERAIALKPDHAEAHFNLALCLLQHGDYRRGWQAYEWRWRLPSFKPLLRNFTTPLWDGSQSLQGKTIVIYSEQGLGDSIQFVRLVPRVKLQGARVILEVPQSLLGLLGQVDGIDELTDRGGEQFAADYHCPMMSLPRALGLTLADLPVGFSYLESDPEHRIKWAARLGAKDGLRVGLVWSGNTQHTNDRHRSLALTSILEALPRGLQYYSLQREVRDSDMGALMGESGIIHFGEELQDFRDTAALSDHMDLIVSVDTSVAHLSAALGRPTWILLPFNPDFRWLLDRGDSPWYPSVRLFRQSSYGDWASVLSTLSKELQSWSQ